MKALYVLPNQGFGYCMARILRKDICCKKSESVFVHDRFTDSVSYESLFIYCLSHCRFPVIVVYSLLIA